MSTLKEIFNYFSQMFKKKMQDENTLNRKNNTLRIIQVVIILLTFSLALFTVLYGSLSFIFIPGLILTGLCFWVGLRIEQKIQFNQQLMALRANWGKELKEKRDFDLCAEFFNQQRERESDFFIDDRTWLDLDMDQVYAKIDRAQTIPGKQQLYYMLRKPELDHQKLKERDRLIRAFQEDSQLRESCQRFLNRVNQKGGEGIVKFLWDELPLNRPIWPYQIMAFLPVIALTLTFTVDTAWFFSIFILFGLNMVIHNVERKQIFKYLTGLFYLGRFIAGTEKFLNMKTDNEDILKLQERISSFYKPVRTLTRKTPVFMFKNDPIAEYLLILFLVEVRTFYKVLELIRSNKRELQEIYQLMGELDAYLSIASYRTELEYYSEPELETGRRLMEVEGLYHPLLKDPVSNSFNMKKQGILITGSNMSGKSTMLRAVGINSLLAQTIYTSLSRRYQGGFYKLITSIGRSDNVIAGDSYYLVEAKALLRIIEGLGQETTTLCIVDEIFRGTNSLERISASSEVLDYLVKENCLLFAATHDLELTEILEERYHNYHFKETVDDKGLTFDYCLHPGPSTTRNAIKLLEFLGYPEEVVRLARGRVTSLEVAKKETEVC